VSPEDPANGGEAAELPIFTRRRLIQTAALVIALLVGIYFLFPKLVGLGNALGKLDEADPIWITVALGFNLVAFATYIALFKAVVGGDALRLSWAETYEINMAGLAATLLFSAGGAGGIVLTFWALRKAGMRRHDVARRMVAFLTLHYAFYPIALFLFGILLRTGVLHGESSVELTIVPAAVAGLLLALGLLFALVPSDLGPRIARFVHGERGQTIARTVGKVPATFGAFGFWAANVGILWASFHAFGVHVPLAVVVQGFFLGMVANLIPFAPAGVGAVDAGMIGAFVLFGIPEDTVFPAILIYRLIAFWTPIPFGVAAFFQLRKTVARWEVEGLPIDRRSATIQSKVLEPILDSGGRDGGREED
jgi:uncharacterized membrane protein YbhN (UPF0104 family)